MECPVEEIEAGFGIQRSGVALGADPDRDPWKNARRLAFLAGRLAPHNGPVRASSASRLKRCGNCYCRVAVLRTSFPEKYSFNVPHPQQVAVTGGAIRYSFIRANRTCRRSPSIFPRSFLHRLHRHSRSRPIGFSLAPGVRKRMLPTGGGHYCGGGRESK